MAKQHNEEIEKMLEGIDFKHLTAEEITGSNGLIKMFTTKEFVHFLTHGFTGSR